MNGTLGQVQGRPPISFAPSNSGSSNSPGVEFSAMSDGPADPLLNFFPLQNSYSNFVSGGTQSGTFGGRSFPQGSSSAAMAQSRVPPTANLGKAIGSEFAARQGIVTPMAQNLANSAATSSGLSTISGPVGMAAFISQQLGQGINAIQTANTTKTIESDYAKNLQQHGTNVGLNSQIVKGQQEAIRDKAFQGGSVGSLFGPIGALIGHAIGGISQSNPDLFKTAVSSGGQFNPSDTRVSQSASTAAPSGISTLQDNVTGN